MAADEDSSAVPVDSAALVGGPYARACLKDCLDADAPSVVRSFCLKLYELKKSLTEASDMFMVGFRKALQILSGAKGSDKAAIRRLSDMCSLLKSETICEQLFATKATQDQRVFIYKLLVLVHLSILPGGKVGEKACDDLLEEAAKFLRLIIGMTGAFEARQFLWQVVFQRFGKKFPRKVARLYELLNLPIPKQLKPYATSQLDEGDGESDNDPMVNVLSKAALKPGEKELSTDSRNDEVKLPSSQGKKKANGPTPSLRRSASMFVDPTQPVLIGLDSSCHNEITKNLTKRKRGKQDVIPFTKHVSFNVQYLSPSEAKFAEVLDKSLHTKEESKSPKSPEGMSPNPYKKRVMSLAPKTPVKAGDDFDLSSFITGHCPSSSLNVTPTKPTPLSPRNKFVTPSKDSAPVDALSSPEVPSPSLTSRSSKRTLAPPTPLFKQKLPSKARNQLCSQPIQTILETPPEKLAKQTCDFKSRRAVAMRLFAQL